MSRTGKRARNEMKSRLGFRRDDVPGSDSANTRIDISWSRLHCDPKEHERGLESTSCVCVCVYAFK